MANGNGTDDDAMILREATMGRALSEIARDRGMSLPEVNRVIDLAAEAAFSGAGMRRQMLLEGERLALLKQKLWVQAMRDGDLQAAIVYCKASERHASMLGWNHGQGYIDRMTEDLVRTETSTENALRVLAQLRAIEPPDDATDFGLETDQ